MGNNNSEAFYIAKLFLLSLLSMRDDIVSHGEEDMPAISGDAAILDRVSK